MKLNLHPQSSYLPYYGNVGLINKQMSMLELFYSVWKGSSGFKSIYCSSSGPVFQFPASGDYNVSPASGDYNGVAPMGTGTPSCIHI